MFKYTIPRILTTLFPLCTWKVKTSDKVLYLTFDDGPHPTITPWVLGQLKQYQAKATFFCVGDNVKKYPSTYEQTLAAGHAVGNHTMHHVKGWSMSNEAYFKEVSEAAGLIQSHLFRPPYGRIKPAQMKGLAQQYKIIMWSLLSRDYDKHLNIAESLNAMKAAKAGDVIVFHDSEKAFAQLQLLLPELLNYYHQQGFKMEALS